MHTHPGLHVVVDTRGPEGQGNNILLTRYSGGQQNPTIYSVTTCCGGLKSPKPHSGVPGCTNPYSGVIVVIQYRGHTLRGMIVCATPCVGVYDTHKSTYEAGG